MGDYSANASQAWHHWHAQRQVLPADKDDVSKNMRDVMLQSQSGREMPSADDSDKDAAWESGADKCQASFSLSFWHGAQLAGAFCL